MDKTKITKQSPKTESLAETAIGPNDGYKRNKEKAAEMEALAQFNHSQRSPERIRRNAMLAVQYRMERYIEDDEVIIENICAIEDFVKDFLKVLGINKTAFAHFIDMDVANLNKYYRSDRRFSTELALKFAHFFHTPADLWLKIQVKNELLILQKEQQLADKYDKYDYEKLLQMV